MSAPSMNDSARKNLAIALGAAAIGLIGVLAYKKYAADSTVESTPAVKVVPPASRSELTSPLGRLRGGGKISLFEPPTSAEQVKHAFQVTTANGFLPLIPVTRRLPDTYSALDALMDKIPTLLRDSNPESLLKAVEALPQYHIPEDATPSLLQSLMRDYSILVSAFLLEGTWKGKAPRHRVPANVSIPFTTVANRLDERWIMAYDSYALTNAYPIKGTLVDPKTGFQSYASKDMWFWDNLRLLRAFDGGPEEYTFIAVHVEIEAHTPELVQSYSTILNAVVADDIAMAKEGLQKLKTTMEKILVAQLKMFNASDPHNYEKFVRPWIFGWKGNADFEGGVVFEGASEEPTFLRGETGAQSTIIPSLDIMLGVAHRSDGLRTMLQELEAYRPKPHRDFLTALRCLVWGCDVGAGGSSDESKGLDAPHAIRDFVRSKGNKEVVRLFNQCIGYIWAFRDIHVTFSAMYIGRYTNKETATGGTPYKAYLRKHRDESIAHQLTEFGDECVVRFFIPSVDDFEAEITTALKDDSPNGIPLHLLTRHADIIEKFGGKHPALERKDFPSSSGWKA